ncbi:unnamed protein product [Paramecium octaurelia]|uniref:Uncharacterized protein n=1 Tax=Paramecium octaurelia TaxID=43137 RepID=A0A8S1UDI4_PAROT|nr:unnamed protein product [Paramecium octaurelia]
MITMKGFKYNSNNSVQFPGPGQYNSDDSICKPKDGSVKIVPEQRSKAMLTKYIPGPGQYSIKSTLEEPAWGFKKEIRSTLIRKDLIQGQDLIIFLLNLMKFLNIYYRYVHQILYQFK